MSLEKIEGIGPANAAKLRQAGVRSVSSLLKKGATPAGRREIAEKSGVSEAQVLKWVNMADLFRIKGVSTQYAELLEAAGVDTVKELATRNPENLHRTLAEVNKARRLVRVLPSQRMVASWVEQAKNLPRAISY